MLKRLAMLLGFLTCATFIFADVQTIKSLPQVGDSFLSTLTDYLRDEISERLFRRSPGFVYSGGIGATDADLTHTISAVVAEVAGYPVSVGATAHTYTNSRTTFVYLHKDGASPATFSISGGTGCTFSARDTHLVFVECGSGSLHPVKPAHSILLFAATTSGNAITAVDDYRPTNAERRDVVNLRDPLVGALCDDNADDTDEINAALSLAKKGHRVVEIPADATCRFTTEIAVPTDSHIRGQNRLTSVLKPVGAIRGLVYDGDVNFEQTATFENFQIFGDYTQTLDLLTLTGQVWGIKVRNMRIRGTAENAIALDEVVGTVIEDSDIIEFVKSGITSEDGFANRITIRNNRFEDFNTPHTVAAINCVESSQWDVTGNSFESAFSTSLTALRLNACANIAFTWNYSERYNHHSVVAHTGASHNITIENNILHTFAPHKLDFATDSLAHTNIVVKENTFDGVSDISKIFLVGSSESYTFVGNRRGTLVEPLEYVEGFPVTTKNVVKVAGSGNQIVYTNGIAIGTWNQTFTQDPAGATTFTIANLENLSTVRVHVGGTNVADFKETETVYATPIRFGSVAHGSLPVLDNGATVYCSDCNKAAPCTSGGTGAVAKRENGVWNCD